MSLFEVKVRPERFEQILKGFERFLVTRYDRVFKRGDTLWLCEYDGARKDFTGRRLSCMCISCVTDYDVEGLAEDFCILTLKNVRVLEG